MADTEVKTAGEGAVEEVKAPAAQEVPKEQPAPTTPSKDGATLPKTGECEGAYGGRRPEPGESDEDEDDEDFDEDDEDYEDEDDDLEEDDEDKEGFMNMLQNFLMSRLHLGGQENAIKDAKSKVSGKESAPKIRNLKVLEDVTVESVVKYITSGQCKNIITMAGAGISTSAGIPDFRTPGTGLYSNLEKYNLPFPEAIFDIEYFKNNPKPFFVLAKELYPGQFCPTPSHWFIRLLHDKGLLLRHYTQNIDTLEHVAGLPADKVVEAHGTFRTSHCVGCRKEYTQEWMKEEIFKDEIPTCTEEECKNLVKPDIIFFRESLPVRFFQLMQADFPKCDLLIILGTSLTVQPFASLVDNVPSMCPRLLINREKCGSMDPMMAMLQGMYGGCSLALDSPNNIRDVALLGDCDEGCTKMAELLGWKDEFEGLLTPKKAEQAEA